MSACYPRLGQNTPLVQKKERRKRDLTNKQSTTAALHGHYAKTDSTLQLHSSQAHEDARESSEDMMKKANTKKASYGSPTVILINHKFNLFAFLTDLILCDTDIRKM